MAAGIKGQKKNRLRFFNRYFDSCTGIACKAKSTKFKIIPQCEELIKISSDFDQPYLDISYNAIAGVKLDSDKGKYNMFLTKNETLEHPGWLAAVEEDKKLLKDYAELVFALLLKKKYTLDNWMGFFIRQDQRQDKLRAFFVGYLDSGSNAVGNDSLNVKSSILRATSSIEKKSNPKM